MDWRRILSYITGTVDEELRLRNEYPAAENRILRAKILGRVPLDDSGRATLARIGKRLGLKALGELAAIGRPDTILAWHRKLVAKKLDDSANRKPGRPTATDFLTVEVWTMKGLVTQHVLFFCHQERNHQGRDNVILLPSPGDRVGAGDGEIVRRERLGGLLSFYHRTAGRVSWPYGCRTSRSRTR